MVDHAKRVVIINLEVLKNVKQMLVTLRHTRYYRNFIKAYANGETVEERCDILLG